MANLMSNNSQHPPPPQPDQHYYNALHLRSAGAQQLLDPVQQERLQYANLSDKPPYPKFQSGTPEQNVAQLRNWTEDVARHAHLEEQQRRQIQQATQHLHNEQSTRHVRTLPTLAPAHAAQRHSAPGLAISNRPRKACDSCSCKKVKVSPELSAFLS